MTAESAAIRVRYVSSEKSWCPGVSRNVDAVAVVIELQNGRGNGNTTLFLDLHPVGYGMARSRFSFYGTGEIDRSSVQQEFLSQCGFTGIRVGNDGKGTPSFNFFCIIRHGFISFRI